jgi:hypothetical protein
MRDSVVAMRPEELCGLLAEHDRLAAFAAVVLGASTPAEVSARSGLTARHTHRALRRLEQGGLVGAVEGRLVAGETAFKEAVREYGRGNSKAGEAAEDLDPDRAKAAVLRVFVRDGRLVQMPVARGKRRIVLEHIVANFEPGVRYPEREVNAVLRAWHPDHASLRRYLVDEALMSRDSGVYWRTGGPVDIS